MSRTRKITTVLPVEAIEPCLPFWEAIGFKVTVDLPQGEALGFVILSDGSTEVMYQSFASIAEDVPAIAEAARRGHAFLFVEVDDIDAVERALAGQPVVLPRRTTFYGATEIGYREPGGHYVTFARFGEPPQ